MKLSLAAFLAATLFAQDYAIEGNAKSPVRVIAYESLQCSDCAVYREMLDAHLLPKYGARVAFEHRDFPLLKHKWSRPAAIAARYFEQTKPETGVAFRRWAFANMRSITPENFKEKLGEWAKSNGADPAKAIAALDDPKLAKLIESDYQEGIARGVARTPTVFVNGQPFIESFTVEEISKGIDAALGAVSAK
jgi:protein-disulfide isomerase